MMSNRFARSTRHGYNHILNGVYSYLRGVWLQFSRGLILVVWSIIAIILSLPFATFGDTIQLITLAGWFLTLPIFVGYIQLYIINRD